jgi:hypothetical protein
MRQDGTLAFKPLMREASSAGDLVFSMGEARLVRGRGTSALLRGSLAVPPEGWRLVFDEVVPRRVPKG